MFSYGYLNLLVFVLSIGFLCHSSQAQEDKNPEQKKQKKQVEQVSDFSAIDEVVAKGRRLGEGASGRRRNRSGRGESIGREDLDKFPGEDAGDALDRLGGVSIGEEGEEGQFFSIGGMAPQLSQITINGQTLGAAGEWGDFSPGNLPADMILSVDVIKSPNAEMEEGASGGSVNLKMRSPLDIGKRVISVSGRLSYEDLADSLGPGLSTFWSDILVEGKLGFLTSLSYSGRATRRDSIDNSGWERVDIDQDGDGTNDDQGVWRARDFKYGYRAESQNRMNVNMVLAFRPTEHMDIKLNGLFSDLNKDLQASSLIPRFNRQHDIVESSVENGIVTVFDSQDQSRKNLRLSSIIRQEKLQAYSLSSEVGWKVRRWLLSADAGFSRSVSSYELPSLSVYFEANSDLAYDISDMPEAPQVEFGVDLDNSDLFSARKLPGRFNDIANDGFYAQFDAAFRPRHSVFKAIKLGIKYREKSRNKKVFRSVVGISPDVFLSDYGVDFPYDDFLSSVAGDHPKSWPVPDIAALDQDFNGQNVPLDLDRIMTFDVQERTMAAYLQGDFRGRLCGEIPFRGNVGFRVVGTVMRSTGAQDMNDAISDVFFRRHYTDILPSASLLVRLKKRLFLRLGAARVMTRPSFTSLSPSLRLNEQQKTGTAGNPDLDPFYANQLDLGFDFNYRKKGRISVALFYKDVDSFFARSKVNDLIDGEEFLMSRPFNGENAGIWGGEASLQQKLSFLPGFLSHMELSAHYSYSDSRTELVHEETGQTLPLPGLVKHFVKGSLIYQKASVVARLTYSYRSDVVKAPFGTGGLPEYAAAMGQVSLGLSYRPAKNMTFSFKGNNLGNSKHVRYAGSPERLLALRSQGRRFSVSLRLKY